MQDPIRGNDEGFNMKKRKYIVPHLVGGIMKNNTSIKIPVQWVKITEISKSKHKGIFYGKLTERGSESVTATVVNEDERDGIFVSNFNLEEYLVEPATEQDVLHLFISTLHKRIREEESKMFDHVDEKRRLERTRAAYASVFNPELNKQPQ